MKKGLSCFKTNVKVWCWGALAQGKYEPLQRTGCSCTQTSFPCSAVCSLAEAALFVRWDNLLPQRQLDADIPILLQPSWFHYPSSCRCMDPTLQPSSTVLSKCFPSDSPAFLTVWSVQGWDWQREWQPFAVQGWVNFRERYNWTNCKQRLLWPALSQNLTRCLMVTVQRHALTASFWPTLHFLTILQLSGRLFL